MTTIERNTITTVVLAAMTLVVICHSMYTRNKNTTEITKLSGQIEELTTQNEALQKQNEALVSQITLQQAAEQRRKIEVIRGITAMTRQLKNHAQASADYNLELAKIDLDLSRRNITEETAIIRRAAARREYLRSGGY